MSSIAHREFIHLGMMDVSKDSIAVAVLAPDRDAAEVDRILHDADSVRRLVKRIGRPKGIWACYEAGPTGYDLQRLLASMGVRCDVVAPSSSPRARVTGSRPTAAIPGDWRGYTEPASSPRSPSRRPPKKACAICAGHAATWSKTSPGPAIG